MHAAAILVGTLQAGDVGVPCQVVHDLHFPPDILHILCRPGHGAVAVRTGLRDSAGHQGTGLLPGACFCLAHTGIALQSAQELAHDDLALQVCTAGGAHCSLRLAMDLQA